MKKETHSVCLFFYGVKPSGIVLRKLTRNQSKHCMLAFKKMHKSYAIDTPSHPSHEL